VTSDGAAPVFHRYLDVTSRAPAAEAGHPPSDHAPYAAWYDGWWRPNLWRNLHLTRAVIGFVAAAVDAWDPTWRPPERQGWVWCPGTERDGAYTPGEWVPDEAVAPDGFVWVPGYWQGDVYVDGWWRSESRDDGGWTWIDGAYVDKVYTPGHWRPVAPGPEGFTFEPGFWKGDGWVDGFWRPALRPGYDWQPAWYDADGVFHAGTWLPEELRPGLVWVPGWFDGTQWIDGWWQPEGEVAAEIEKLASKAAPPAPPALSDKGASDKPLGLAVASR
jgi:hypothetical protein